MSLSPLDNFHNLRDSLPRDDVSVIRVCDLLNNTSVAARTTKGVEITTHERGTVYKSNWCEGVLHGQLEAYNEDGVKIYSIGYQMGKKHGEERIGDTLIKIWNKGIVIIGRSL